MITLIPFNYGDVLNYITVELSDILQRAQNYCLSFNNICQESHVSDCFTQSSIMKP